MDLNLSKYTYTQNWFLISEIKRDILHYVNKKQKYNILEIGCFEGLSACGFSDNILDHKESTLDCVDPFVLSGTNSKITTTCVTSDTELMFRKNINLSKNSKKITFHKMTSDDFFLTNKKLFNFIYIDGCHELEFIINDMENSFKCLEQNGIMWMDDYGGGGGKIKIYMDRFLEKYKGQYNIIHKNYQLAIRKL